MLTSIMLHNKTKLPVIYLFFPCHVTQILHSDWLSGLLQKVEAFFFQISS